MEITWTPPKDWMRIKTIDAHTAGDPLRVILEGFPSIPGRNIFVYLKDQTVEVPGLENVH